MCQNFVFGLLCTLNLQKTFLKLKQPKPLKNVLPKTRFFQAWFNVAGFCSGNEGLRKRCHNSTECEWDRDWRILVKWQLLSVVCYRLDCLGEGRPNLGGNPHPPRVWQGCHLKFPPCINFFEKMWAYKLQPYSFRSTRDSWIAYWPVWTGLRRGVFTVHLCRVAGNTVWSHMASDTP